MRSNWQILPALLCVLFAPGHDAWADYHIFSERFGYTGGWSRFGTLSDATTNSNQLGTGTVPQRDILLDLGSDGSGLFAGNAAAFITIWYLDTANNPNNTNDGFMQLYDYTGTSDPLATVTSNSGAWNDAHDLFSVSISGADAVMDYAGLFGHNEFARLGIGPDTGVIPSSGSASQVTWGRFHSYEFNAQFSVPGAVETSPGIWQANTEPTSMTGTFTAIFENTAQNTNPNPNSGFYRVTLDFNDISWAFANNLTTVSSFASNVVLVPEPSGAVLCVVAPFVFLCRRSRRQRGPAASV